MDYLGASQYRDGCVLIVGIWRTGKLLSLGRGAMVPSGNMVPEGHRKDDMVKSSRRSSGMGEYALHAKDRTIMMPRIGTHVFIEAVNCGP